MIRNVEVLDQLIIYTRYEMPPDGLVEALAPFKAQYREIQVGGASGRAPELVLLVNCALSMLSNGTYDLMKPAVVRAWDWARNQLWSDRVANETGAPSASLKLYVELDNHRRARFDISASDPAVLELALDRLPKIIDSVQKDGVGLWLEGEWKYYE